MGLGGSADEDQGVGTMIPTFFYRWNARRVLLAFTGWFLLQIVLLPILVNLISSFLQMQYGQQPAEMRWLIIVVVVLTSAISLFCLYLALRERPERKAMASQHPHPYPGLIVLVGIRGTRNVEPDALAHNPAIEYHLNGLKAEGKRLRVWLLASPASISVANGVEERYKKECEIEIRNVQDAFHVQNTYDVARGIYEEAVDRYQLNPDSILADFTGGTTPMSVGLALAAQDYPMQYMYGGQKAIETEPVEIRLVKKEKKKRRQKAG